MVQGSRFKNVMNKNISMSDSFSFCWLSGLITTMSLVNEWLYNQKISSLISLSSARKHTGSLEQWSRDASLCGLSHRVSSLKLDRRSIAPPPRVSFHRLQTSWETRGDAGHSSSADCVYFSQGLRPRIPVALHGCISNHTRYAGIRHLLPIAARREL